ncbi:MAG: hypothetical protein AAF824_17885, partial [Bacteroidota bacterium]
MGGPDLTNKGFIEVEVQNHMILHGFDENNKEILEEIAVEKPMKKLLAIGRIRSISEKYILTTYAFGRYVYWEYKGSYQKLKRKIQRAAEE